MKCTTVCVLLAAIRVVNSDHGNSSLPWEEFILSPTSRTPSPTSIQAISGDAVVHSDDNGYVLALSSGSHISLDFGVEVGGLVSFGVVTNSSGPQFSLAFAESPSFVRPISDDTGALPSEDYDLALNVSVTPGQTFYIMPSDRFRGGFRFMTINALAHITISNVTCEIGFAPGVTDLRDYSGYFYTSQDRDLVRAWYAGAYTVQTNIAPQNTGRFLPQVKPGWDYNASLGVAAPVLLDGAKRDRAVWPGDIGLSGTSAMLALGKSGMEAVKNALETIFYYQNSTTGEFPFAGPDTASFRSGSTSDTYHAWSLISIYNYAIYSGDTAWLEYHWANITRGMTFITASLDNDVGLHNQTQPNDWGRQGAGGYNSALNALDYHCLISVSSIAITLSNQTGNNTKASQAETWSAAASRLKASYNTLLWDPSTHLYRDNETTAGSSLHPQDGNALALLFNLPPTASHATALSTALTLNWTPIGPVTPELPDTISPFISGIEVLAHFTAGQPTRALELIRRTWGYLLDSPLMTGSTLAEGITANGSLYYRSTAGYNYDASYTSLSHGWSSGPTQALLAKAVGVEVTGLGRWRFRPQPGDLGSARGGFWTPAGQYEAGWEVGSGNGTVWMEGELKTPNGTVGAVEMPWDCERVSLNGVDLKGGSVEGGPRYRIQAVGCK